MHPRRLTFGTIVLLAALATPSAAMAGTLGGSGGYPASLAFQASPGEQNDLSVDVARSEVQGDGFTVTDAGAPLQLTGGCNAGSPVFCPGEFFSLIDVDLGDRADRASVVAYPRASTVNVSAGKGDDRVKTDSNSRTQIFGGPGGDLLELNSAYFGLAEGQDGDDTIVGRGDKGTVIRGGDGNDFIEGLMAYSTLEISGGAGNDTMIAGAIGVDLHGPATFTGGPGDDLVAFLNPGCVTGGFPQPCPFVSTIETGDGDDTIAAAPAWPGRTSGDVIASGNGNDEIDVRGNALADSVRCGGGWDEVYVDAQDIVDRSCEAVRAYTPPAAFTTRVQTALTRAAAIAADYRSPAF